MRRRVTLRRGQPSTSDIRKRAKLLWLNYPNNPTAATAPDDSPPSLIVSKDEGCGEPRRQHSSQG